MKSDLVREELQRAIDIFGSQEKFANAIGAYQQKVSYWLDKGWVPPEFVIPIEKAANGQVSRHKLRPDIYPIEE